MRKIPLKRRKPVHAAAVVLFILYLVGLVYVLFFLEARDQTYHNVNLVPFKTIRMLFQYFFTYHHFSLWYWISNVFGNILLLAPFGFLLPLIRHRRMNVWIILLLSILLSAVIEGCQFFTGVGEADIDDVILNATGALLGYGLYRFLGALFQSSSGGNPSC